MASGGLSHCNAFFPWDSLDKAIRGDGEGGLLWEWLCPLCGEAVRCEPFAFPSDMPAKDEGRVGSEA